MKLQNLTLATAILLALTGCGSSGGGSGAPQNKPTVQDEQTQKQVDDAKKAKEAAEQKAEAAQQALAEAKLKAEEAQKAQAVAEQNAEKARQAQATAEKKAEDARQAQIAAEKKAQNASEQSAEELRKAQAAAEQKSEEARQAQTAAEQKALEAQEAKTTAEQNAEKARQAQTAAEQKVKEAQRAQADAEQKATDAQKAQAAAEQRAEDARQAQSTAEQKAEVARQAQIAAEKKVKEAEEAKAAAEQKAQNATEQSTEELHKAQAVAKQKTEEARQAQTEAEQKVKEAQKAEEEKVAKYQELFDLARGFGLDKGTSHEFANANLNTAQSELSSALDKVIEQEIDNIKGISSASYSKGKVISEDIYGVTETDKDYTVKKVQRKMLYNQKYSATIADYYVQETYDKNSGNLADFDTVMANIRTQGLKTQVANLPKEGSATYSGKAFHSLVNTTLPKSEGSNSSKEVKASGNMSYTVNFADKTGSGKIIGLGDQIILEKGEISGSGISSKATTKLDNTPGSYSLDFFGKEAEEIGGKVSFDQKDSISFGGSRGEIKK